MQKWGVAAIPLIVLVALFGVFAKGLFVHSEVLPSNLVHHPLPPITLPTLANPAESVNLTSLKGKYRLLNVFASWCVSCMAEHPYLITLAKSQQIEIIGFNWKDDPAKAKILLEKLGNPYHQVLTDQDGKAAISLGVTGAPETYLISPEGIILHKVAGVLSEEIVEQQIRPLLKE